MHRLHRLLREDGRLAEAVGDLNARLGDHPLIHGLVVEYNPVWAAAARLAQAGLDPDLLLGDVGVRGGVRFDIATGSGLLAGAEAILGRANEPLDVTVEYDAARWLTRSLFGRAFEIQPYLLRVMLDPAAGDLRADVLGLARENSLPVVVETRAPARLVSRPGAPVRSGPVKTGTLGGYLRDKVDGEVYAATCGHVLDSPAGVPVRVDIGSGAPGAAAIHAQAPISLPHGQRCRRGCADLTRLDLALIGAPGLTARNVARSVGDIDSGDRVEMRGATSGARTYQVGGACVFRKLGPACFDEVWDLRPPTAGLLAPALSLLTSAAPRDGDSGAWLLRNGDVWTGMVVAADALFGYALSSDLLLSEGGAAFGLDLELA